MCFLRSKATAYGVLTVIVIILAIVIGNVAARSQPAEAGAVMCRPADQGMAILSKLADLRQAELRSLKGDPLKRFFDFLDAHGMQLDREQIASVILLRFPDGHAEFAALTSDEVAVCAARQFVIPATAVGAMLHAVDGLGV